MSTMPMPCAMCDCCSTHGSSFYSCVRSAALLNYKCAPDSSFGFSVQSKLFGCMISFSLSICWCCCCCYFCYCCRLRCWPGSNLCLFICYSWQWATFICAMV